MAGQPAFMLRTKRVQGTSSEIYERLFTNIITTLRYQTSEQTFQLRNTRASRITNLFHNDKIMRMTSVHLHTSILNQSHDGTQNI